MLRCEGSSNIMLRPPGEQDPGRSAVTPTFSEWLQHRLEASRLTQRQVAVKSGIDHSTVSRLLSGDRMPSLRTATLLAKAFGGAGAVTMADDMDRPASSSSRLAAVEHALRSDESLTEAEVRRIMDYYLMTRRVRPAAAPPRAKPSGPKVSVPIVVQVPKDGALVRPPSPDDLHRGV